MKANRLAKDEGGDFGIGTMIVFIAMIIVAVVAATVMVTTMSKLQSEAEKVGDEALQQMSSGVNVKNVLGSRITTGSVITDFLGREGEKSTFIQDLDILVELRAGSLPMDLDRLIVRIVTDREAVNYVGEIHDEEDARPFAELRAVRDTDGSITRDHAMNKMGDVAAIKVDVSDLEIGPGETFEVQIIPDVGGIPTTCGVRTPISYPHDAEQVQLYP